MASPDDVKLVSLHWGGNWGYAITELDRRFANDLIDRAGADIVYGHSSHHPKGIEVYRGKLILYGCGDLINDYEGIAGQELYRGDLGVMYFVTIDTVRREPSSLELVAMRRRRFALERAPSEDAAWLSNRLDEEGRQLGTRMRLRADGVLELCW